MIMKYLPPLLIALVLILYLASVYTTESRKTEVCFDGGCIDAEIARTPDQRATGLMFQKSLPKDSGMLFVFDAEGVYPFWMKNTLIPLDILWIDSDSRIVFIARDAQPCTTTCQNIEPGVAAKYVLEINAGISEAKGIKVGDSVRIGNA